MPVVINGQVSPPPRLIRIIDVWGQRWCVRVDQMADPSRKMLALHRRNGKRALDPAPKGQRRDPSPSMIHRGNIAKCTGESPVLGEVY